MAFAGGRHYVRPQLSVRPLTPHRPLAANIPGCRSWSVWPLCEGCDTRGDERVDYVFSTGSVAWHARESRRAAHLTKSQWFHECRRRTRHYDQNAALDQYVKRNAGPSCPLRGDGALLQIARHQQHNPVNQLAVQDFLGTTST